MTTSEQRATVLTGALRAAVARDRAALSAAFTDDVRAWTPALSTSSLTELLDELDHRDAAFSEIELAAEPLDLGGQHACVEWTVRMRHTGAISLTDDVIIEPSGIGVTVHGVTIAEFDGDRICSLRQYWDESSVLEQLGVAADASSPAAGR